MSSTVDSHLSKIVGGKLPHQLVGVDALQVLGQVLVKGCDRGRASRAILGSWAARLLQMPSAVKLYIPQSVHADAEFPSASEHLDSHDMATWIHCRVCKQSRAVQTCAFEHSHCRLSTHIVDVPGEDGRIFAIELPIEGVLPGDQDLVVILDQVAHCGVGPEGVLLSCADPSPLHVLHAQRSARYAGSAAAHSRTASYLVQADLERLLCLV